MFDRPLPQVSVAEKASRIGKTAGSRVFRQHRNMNEETTYEELYRTVVPSVVSVYVARDVERGARAGAGSGFVYDGEHVLTNQHVVGASEEVELRFSRGEWRAGSVVGSDAYTDLAVVSVADLPAYAGALPIATSTPSPGRRVAAFGNPMGLDGTITTGIVSGTGRSTPTGNGFAIPDTVQTDAPINPGNSGGPLVTLDGEVVGVNRARAGDNIGFAISPAIVERVVPTLVAEGRYDHPYLNVRTVDVSPSVAEANGLDEPRGVLVVDVPLGPSSAALVGTEGKTVVRGREVPVGGDVIVGIGGTEIRSHEELTRYLILETRPGETVEVDVLRAGRRLTEYLTLGGRPQTGTRRTRDGEGGAEIPIE
jgi:serine protease Do